MSKDQPKQKETPNKKENSFNVFFIGLCVIIPFAAQYLYQLDQVVKQRIAKFPDVNLPQYSHFSVALQWTVVLSILRYVFGNYIFVFVGNFVVSKKYEKEEREKKVQRFGHLLFKLSYFVLFSSYGYYVLKDQDWLPPAFGGSGSVKECFTKGFPVGEVDTNITYYYMIGLSYHIMSLIYHLMMPKKADFLEMFLHHVITIFLVFFSFMSGYLKIGTLVYISHDSSDVFSYLIKTMIDTQNVPLNLISFVLLLISWGYARLFAFPVYIISECIKIEGPEIHGYYFFNTMLIMLYCLHVYWYGLFLRMGYMYATKGTLRDSQVDGFKDKNAKKDK